MARVKLKAKHNVSIAFKDKWVEIASGDTIYGELNNDLIVIKTEDGLMTDVAVFACKDVSENFELTIIKG